MDVLHHMLLVAHRLGALRDVLESNDIAVTTVIESILLDPSMSIFLGG